MSQAMLVLDPDMCEVITVVRSDGQVCDPDPGGVEMLPNSVKYIEWCRKLGHWLAMAIGPDAKFKSKQFILARLPEGFTLREHQRTVTTTADGHKKRTTSDVYLHGYSTSPAQKYRSPAEFFPHLLWLATDFGSCGCKFCPSLPAAKATGTLTTSPAPEKKQNTTAEFDQNLDPALLQEVVKPELGGAQAPSPNAPHGLMLMVRTQEQALDSEVKGPYLYRPGELIWFNKNVSTWGLAVIAARGLVDGKAHYTVQPLSHPLYHPDIETKVQAQLRPWLAWSVPALGNQSLQDAKYDQVPWPQIINQYPGDPVVDGSILAAASIDASYSFFEPDTSALSHVGETVYKGMYLGAEKIWVGEPVRLRGPGDGIFVLIVKKIIDSSAHSPANPVTLHGDVYTLTRMPTPIQSREIPDRLEDDLDYRNRVEGSAQRGLYNDWRIVEPNAAKSLNDVKGRWYETEYLLPILQGEQEFQQANREGSPGDCGQWMNTRGDVGMVNLRQSDRESTFGQAVPAHFRVHQGLDDVNPPPNMALAPMTG